jgi:glycyl-tRNA synthetase (class II)
MEKLGIKVSHVEFLETPKSKSTFYAWNKWDFWTYNPRWR